MSHASSEHVGYRIPLRIPVIPANGFAALMFTACKPFQVELVLPRQIAPAPWVFARELLVDGMSRSSYDAAGVDGGNVRVHREADWLRVHLRALWSVDVDLYAQMVDEFLSTSFQIVPLGSERDPSLTDAALADLLR